MGQLGDSDMSFVSLLMEYALRFLVTTTGVRAKLMCGAIFPSAMDSSGPIEQRAISEITAAYQGILDACFGVAFASHCLSAEQEQIIHNIVLGKILTEEVGIPIKNGNIADSGGQDSTDFYIKVRHEWRRKAEVAVNEDSMGASYLLHSMDASLDSLFKYGMYSSARSRPLTRFFSIVDGTIRPNMENMEPWLKPMLAPPVKEGCFIATACFGDKNAPEVIAFRNYRDVHLLKSKLGVAFITAYYAISPSIANFLSRHPLAANFTRLYLLTPLARIIRTESLQAGRA